MLEDSKEDKKDVDLIVKRPRYVSEFEQWLAKWTCLGGTPSKDMGFLRLYNV